MLLHWIHAAQVNGDPFAMIENMLHSINQDRKTANINENVKEITDVKVGPFDRKSGMYL